MYTRVLTLSLAASQTAVFNFLADIENLPAWTGGFCEWIELGRAGWLAYTALGEMDVETKVDDLAQEIDVRLRHCAGWTLVIPLSVRSDGEDGTIVSASCRQAAGMSDGQYGQLFDSLLGGLQEVVQRLPAPLEAI